LFFSLLARNGLKAIRNAFTARACFVFFANLVILTLFPHVVGLADLLPFAAGSWCCGNTLPCVAELAYDTLAGKADRLFCSFAVGIVKAFNANASCSAMTTAWTVMIRTTNTAVIRGTFLCGTGFRLAMFVFQTGSTTACDGVLFQTAFWTILTSLNDYRNITAT
jgi:hypothetical protein